MNSTTPTTHDSVDEGQLLAIVQQIGRYGMTTFATAHQLGVFEGCGLRMVKQALKECQRRNWIGTAWLDQTRRYWFLKRKGANATGLDGLKTGPHSEPAKIRAAALLYFCIHGKRQRHLLTSTELQNVLEGEQLAGLPTGYYFDPSGEGKLGLARIDAGRQGRWDRIIESVRRDTDRLLRIQRLSQLSRNGRFEISVITVLPEKAARLKAAMLKHSDLNRIPINVVACPELIPLIASTSTKKGR